MGVCHFCALPTTSHVVSLQQDVKAGIISHMLLMIPAHVRDGRKLCGSLLCDLRKVTSPL